MYGDGFNADAIVKCKNIVRLLRRKRMTILNAQGHTSKRRCRSTYKSEVNHKRSDKLQLFSKANVTTRRISTETNNQLDTIHEPEVTSTCDHEGDVDVFQFELL